MAAFGYGQTALGPPLPPGIVAPWVVLMSPLPKNLGLALCLRLRQPPGAQRLSLFCPCGPSSKQSPTTGLPTCARKTCRAHMPIHVPVFKLAVFFGCFVAVQARKLRRERPTPRTLSLRGGVIEMGAREGERARFLAVLRLFALIHSGWRLLPDIGGGMCYKALGNTAVIFRVRGGYCKEVLLSFSKLK